VRLFARTFLVGMVAAGMTSMPAAAAGLPGGPNAAASEKPLGMVVLATNAHVDSAEAAMGANVYGGDVLDTTAGGTLRMKVGRGQVYLLSESAASLVPEEKHVHAKLERGTMGFAGPSSEGIEIETPVGVVKAAEGQERAFGQVMLRSATEIIVTSYTGTLVVDSASGEEHVIEEGKTYDVAVEPGAPAQKYGVTSAGNTHVVAKVIIVGGAALAGFFLWCAESVSDYHPPCN